MKKRATDFCGPVQSALFNHESIEQIYSYQHRNLYMNPLSTLFEVLSLKDENFADCIKLK